MNLIPIEPGTPSPEAVDLSTGTEGRFAELMAGLMSGDAQIAPVLDLPITGDEPPVGDHIESDGAADSLLAAVGTPPTGVVIGDAAQQVEQIEQVVRVEHAEQVSSVARLTLPTRSPELSPTTTDQQPGAGPAQLEATDVTSSAAPLASVHPLTRAIADKGDARPQPAASEAVAAPSDAEIAADGDHPTITPIRSTAATPQPVTIDPQPAADSRIDAQTQNTATPNAAEPAQVVDAPSTDPDVEFETTSLIRTPEASLRSGSAPTGPALVGIARRVEEAIAALATKPDPKIVTLQLDELDGIRLTVALRPDGLHLSSNGHATLTGEIERALASRGFEMASDTPQRDPRGEADRADDDGWQPRFADRRHRTDRNGIRF